MAVGAVAVLGASAMADTTAREVGMAVSNALVKVTAFLFVIAIAHVFLIIITIPRALGAIALLAGDDPVVSVDDARRIRRVYIGTTALSIFWILLNGHGFWVLFVFGNRAHGGWGTQIIGNLMMGHFLFPLCWSSWWATMKMGSALARQRVLRVIKAAETTRPSDDAAWQSLVDESLALDSIMAQLSHGWSLGLAGISVMIGSVALSSLASLVNQPYHDARIASNSEVGHTKTGNILLMVLWFVAPLVIAGDVAQTSSCCDQLMDKLNYLGIKHGEKHHGRIDWLETRLRRLHHSQGLGFVIFGMVLDRRSLGKLAFAVGSGLITVITWALALSGETVVAASPPGACGLDAAQQLQVNEFATRYAHTLLANATCVTWS